MKVLRGLLPALLLLPLAGCGQAPDLSTPPERLWIVGVESMSLRYARDLADAGKLPHVATILAEGAQVELTAHLPLEPASLWTSVLTGKLPRQHQILSQMTVVPGGQRTLTPSSLRRCRSLWQILGERNRLSASVGFPATWPVEIVNGFVVTNSFTRNRWVQTSENQFPRVPGHLETWPLTLYREILPLVRDPEKLPREVASRFFTLREEDYKLLYDDPLGSVYRRENPLKDFAITYQSDLSTVDIALMLQERYDPPVVGLYLELLDTVQPVFWYFARPEAFGQLPQDSQRRYGRTVEETYRWVDEQIGRVMERMGEHDTLLVVSERGFGVQGGTGLEGEPVEPTPLPDDQGCLLLYGQGIAAGARGKGTLPDVTPTVLVLEGLPIAGDMDGRVLRETLDPSFLAAHPTSTLESYDEGWDSRTRYPSEVTPADSLRTP